MPGRPPTPGRTATIDVGTRHHGSGVGSHSVRMHSARISSACRRQSSTLPPRPTQSRYAPFDFRVHASRQSPARGGSSDVGVAVGSPCGVAVAGRPSGGGGVGDGSVGGLGRSVGVGGSVGGGVEDGRTVSVGGGGDVRVAVAVRRRVVGVAAAVAASVRVGVGVAIGVATMYPAARPASVGFDAAVGVTLGVGVTVAEGVTVAVRAGDVALAGTVDVGSATGGVVDGRKMLAIRP